MDESAFLPLPEGLLIDQVKQIDTKLIVTVISTKPLAACPGCGCLSEHVHSQYQRTVKDVPSGGQEVVLRIYAGANTYEGKNVETPIQFYSSVSSFS